MTREEKAAVLDEVREAIITMDKVYTTEEIIKLLQDWADFLRYYE